MLVTKSALLEPTLQISWCHFHFNTEPGQPFQLCCCGTVREQQLLPKWERSGYHMNHFRAPLNGLQGLPNKTKCTKLQIYCAVLYLHRKIIHIGTVSISIFPHKLEDIMLLKMLLPLSFTGNLCFKQQAQVLDQCPGIRQPGAIVMVVVELKENTDERNQDMEPNTCFLCSP